MINHLLHVYLCAVSVADKLSAVSIRIVIFAIIYVSYVSTWVSETNMVVSPTESRAVGSFFMMVGGLGERMWGSWEKFYILSFFFENIISGIQLFHIRPVDIIRDLFFNFTTSSRNSQNQQKLTKKITHFIIQFCSKNLTHFTNLNSLDTESNIISQHSQ